jgi:galactokinase
VDRHGFGPGRVNLIGDHTDYTGGLVLPMAIDLGTTVCLRSYPMAASVELTSADEEGTATVPIAVVDAGAGFTSPPGPLWARYVAAGVAAAKPAVGGRGRVTSTLPIGAGLSSSTSLVVAVAVALGLPTGPDDAVASARLCQQAEQLACGVPGGLMDQLASLGGVEGHALLIDCTSLELEPIAMPAGVEVLVAHSGQDRLLSLTAYAERRSECDRAAALIGPLSRARRADLAAIADPVVRRRARHVLSENERVRAFAVALAAGDLATTGQLMLQSHDSLAKDFEASTPALDSLVEALVATPGVLGARLTGAGFGGCVVALTERGAVNPGMVPYRCWVVRPAGGAKAW